MRTLVAIVLGLVMGAAAAVGLAVAAYTLVPPLPAPTAPSTAAPAVLVPTPTPAPTPAATAPAQTPQASASRGTSPFPLVGKAAPPLVAPDLNGAPVDLASFRGKPVWLVFTGTYAPSSKDEYPLMNGYAARYAGTGLVVLAVHVKEDAATVKPFVDGLDVTFPVLLDEDGTRAQAWDAAALPVHYWIDAQGIVRDAALGGLGADAMVAGLASILGDAVGGQ